MLSTISDYQKFGSELLNSKLGKSNLLVSNDTADIMMINHLSNNLDMTELSKFKLSGEEYYKGVGYGLGGSIVINSSLFQQDAIVYGDKGIGGLRDIHSRVSTPSHEPTGNFVTPISFINYGSLEGEMTDSAHMKILAGVGVETSAERRVGALDELTVRKRLYLQAGELRLGTELAGFLVLVSGPREPGVGGDAGVGALVAR